MSKNVISGKDGTAIIVTPEIARDVICSLENQLHPEESNEGRIDFDTDEGKLWTIIVQHERPGIEDPIDYLVDPRTGEVIALLED